MKNLGGFKIAFLTCFVIALSISVALYGFDVVRVFRSAADSPGNRTGGRVLEKSPFHESLYVSIAEDEDTEWPLQDDFYRDTCPNAEVIIGKAIRDIYDAKPSIAPSLIRLLFHDCFIEGCDASVLLDADEAFTSEKDAIPNLTLKGFDVIDSIKLKLENICPGVVSCADILVLAAREAVLVAGGPMYLLKTGRKDSPSAFMDLANEQLPSPHANLSEILARFYSRGFSGRETVSLLGAHSIGITHCSFFEDRLYNYSGTGKPDPELNPGFLQELKTKCPFSASASSPSSSPGNGLAPSLPTSDYPENKYDRSSGNRNERVVDLSFNNEGGDENFGTRFYKRLMQKKGVMFSDQQLTSSEGTEMWVRAYATDALLFRRDFEKSMTKLSTYNVLTGPLGQIRSHCSKRNSILV